MSNRRRNGTSVFCLGQFAFAIQDSDQNWLDGLSRLLPECKTESDVPVLDLATRESAGVSEILTNAKRHHIDAIWIDASYLVAPTHKTVLIAGRSGSGKTTLSISLAFGHNWGIICEGNTFIDPHAEGVIPYLAPFNLKRTPVETLERLAQVPLSEPVFGSWISSKPFSIDAALGARIDYAFLVESARRQPEASGRCRPISSAQFLRKLLPVSTLACDALWIERMSMYLRNSACYVLEEGSLRSRINAVTNICGRDFNSASTTGLLGGSSIRAT